MQKIVSVAEAAEKVCAPPHSWLQHAVDQEDGEDIKKKFHLSLRIINDRCFAHLLARERKRERERERRRHIEAGAVDEKTL